MNLDDFKTLTKSVKAPANAPSGDTHLDSFIAELRARDQREHRRHLGMALVLLPVGLVFLASGVSHGPGNGMTGLGIAFVAVYLGARGRWFTRVDYAAPTREFLAAAAKRYRFWRVEDMLFEVPLLLGLGLGGGLTVWMTALKYFGPDGVRLALAGFGMFLSTLCVFGWIAARKKWRLESGGLLAEIRQRQAALNNG